MTPGERLVDHALALRWDDLPDVSRRAARQFLHDSLCVGAAGARAAHADAVLDMVRGWGVADVAGILGRPGLRLPAASAAFINAFQIHGQEYDCVHEPAVLHPMATILATVLAEAARGDAVDGRRFLTAIAAGADVAVALGVAAGPLSFFRPATAGIFGCVAAIASLRGLGREVALDAFGHALAFASGTMQAHVEGKPALPVQVANAARNALAAVDLARAGVPGVRHPIDGPFGYFALLEVEARCEILIEGLDRPGSRIAEVSWKPFPTGRAGHGGIVAVRQLMERDGLTADNLDRLTFRAPPLIHRLVGRPVRPAMEPGYARLCLPWLIAVTLRYGTVSLDHFATDYLHDPESLALAARVEVIADDNPDPAAFVPAVATAHTRDGRILRCAVEAQFGAPEWPLTAEQQSEKARTCLRFAGMEAVDEPLRAVVYALDEAVDVITALERTGLFG